MLYYLFDYLEQFDFPGARMFGYVSFRSLMAIILALLISTIFGEYFITLLKKKQITEVQRDASIDPFNVNKKGVPTMGGLIIIFATLIPCLLLGKLHNIYMILMLITTIWLGTLGFLDDYIKTFRKANQVSIIQVVVLEKWDSRFSRFLVLTIMYYFHNFASFLNFVVLANNNIRT